MDAVRGVDPQFERVLDGDDPLAGWDQLKQRSVRRHPAVSAGVPGGVRRAMRADRCTGDFTRA